MKRSAKTQAAAQSKTQAAVQTKAQDKAQPKAQTRPLRRASRQESATSRTQKPQDNSWQSPIVGLWAEKYPAWARKHQKPSRLRKKPSRSKVLEYRILATLAFFSISVGLWENFRQLWLQQNGFTATDVGNIIGFGTLASVISFIIVGRYVKMVHVKKLTAAMLTFSCVNLLILALLNGTGLNILIVICAILDIASSAVIITSIYPLLTTVVKSNSAYSRRKLVEYLFRDFGILIGGIFIGQQIAGFLIDYNACLLIAIAFLVVSNVIIYRLDLNFTEKAPEDTKFSAVRYALRNKVQRTYMLFTFIGGISYNAAIALKMLMLTDSFGFSAGIATNYLLIVGLSADVLGILALRHFTPKSDRVTMFLKFGIRSIILAVAFLSSSAFICFLALTWTLLSSTAYENITDGYYINSVDNRYQLKYNTLRYIIHYLGTAIGTFLCGQMFRFGPGPIFGVAAVITIVQIFIAFRLIRIRESSRRSTNKYLRRHPAK